jgi:hypothetical protein
MNTLGFETVMPLWFWAVMLCIVVLFYLIATKWGGRCKNPACRSWWNWQLTRESFDDHQPNKIFYTAENVCSECGRIVMIDSYSKDRERPHEPLDWQ